MIKLYKFKKKQSEYIVSAVTKELTASKKVMRSRAEAKSEADVDMVRREEWAMAKGKQQALKDGEDYY